MTFGSSGTDQDFSLEMYRGILAVNSALSRRLTHLSPICPLCDSSEETLQNLFLECQIARLVWNNTGFLFSQPPPIFHDWLLDWIISLAATPTQKDHFFNFVAYVWAIWKSRNGKVFSDTPFLPTAVLALAVNNALWFKRLSLWNSRAQSAPRHHPQSATNAS